MTSEQLLNILKLRVSVGFIGESHEESWWPCSFFALTSTAFLSPVFGKTTFSAKYYGVKQAATIKHDEHIGIGKGVYHLFRLPEMLERELHEMLENKEIVEQLSQIISNRQSAEQFLKGYAIDSQNEYVGPIKIAATTELEKSKVWQTAAQYYLIAFQRGTKTYPYFSEA